MFFMSINSGPKASKKRISIAGFSRRTKRFRLKNRTPESSAMEPVRHSSGPRPSFPAQIDIHTPSIVHDCEMAWVQKWVQRFGSPKSSPWPPCFASALGILRPDLPTSLFPLTKSALPQTCLSGAPSTCGSFTSPTAGSGQGVAPISAPVTQFPVICLGQRLTKTRSGPTTLREALLALSGLSPVDRLEKTIASGIPEE